MPEGIGGKQHGRLGFDRQKLEKRNSVLRRREMPFEFFCFVWPLSFVFLESRPKRSLSRRVKNSILLFTSLFAIPLACKGSLDAALLTGLQVVGVTLDFLDDVLRLYLPLEPAQRIFQRFAFLYANLNQNFHLQTCL
jgi:hypothetical protein